ncbi:MAG: carboxypeptidase-like regulatory domain-containing protein [Cyclobacteriaceae bacterium]|nr:carboxypeptidase-like regulatory domain-containing protein [Cyclobacteriaceae bacterium]
MNGLKTNLSKLLSVFVLIVCCFGIHQANAQEQQVVQLSGIIVADDGTTELPGVHVYVPEYGRGTTTNVYGYFSMPALVGDHVVLSSVGFIKQDFIVPSSSNGRVNVMIKMQTDTVYLENIDITPFLSEKMFKQAILAMRLPEDQGRAAGSKLDGDVLSAMAGSVPYDAQLNATYYFNQQLYYMQDSYGPRSNPFLNPFNWAKFINSLNSKKK